MNGCGGVSAPDRGWQAAVLCWGLLLASVLVACGASDEHELQRWMDAQRARLPVRVPAIEPPLVFHAQAYDVDQTVQPFSVERVHHSLPRAEAAKPSQALLEHQLQRPRQRLEGHALDAMAMVGSLQQGGRQVALLRVEQELHQVAVGQYIGQNYGRVTRVIEQRVDLLEIVQDAAGAWVERPAALHLLRPASAEGARP
jgi:type IV pilus assembly protein PilP